MKNKLIIVFFICIFIFGCTKKSTNNTETSTNETLYNNLTVQESPETEEKQVPDVDIKEFSYYRINSPEGLRVRESASLDSNIINKYPDNFIVLAREKDTNLVEIDGIKSYWVQISHNNDPSGWVFGGYLKPTEDFPPDSSDKLNQYENDDSETDEKYDYTEKVLALYEEFYSKYLPDGYYHGQEIPISIFNEWKKKFEFTGWTERKEEGKFGEFVWKFQHYKNDYCEIQFSDESDEIVAWEGTTMTKTIPNSLGIEIGMTKNQVEEIIGSPFSNIYNEYDDGYRYVRFNFNNEILESIQVFYNSMAGY